MYETLDLVLSYVNKIGPRFGMLALDEGIVDGQDSPADAPSGFDRRYSCAISHQLDGSGKPGQTSSNHDDRGVVHALSLLPYCGQEPPTGVPRPGTTYVVRRVFYLMMGMFSDCLTISIGWKTGSEDPLEDSASIRWRKEAGPVTGA
jgi:hypothetical protein